MWIRFVKQLVFKKTYSSMLKANDRIIHHCFTLLAYCHLWSISLKHYFIQIKTANQFFIAYALMHMNIFVYYLLYCNVMRIFGSSVIITLTLHAVFETQSKRCRSSWLESQAIYIKLKKKSTKISWSSSKVVGLGLTDLWEFPTLLTRVLWCLKSLVTRLLSHSGIPGVTLWFLHWFICRRSPSPTAAGRRFLFTR